MYFKKIAGIASFAMLACSSMVSTAEMAVPQSQDEQVFATDALPLLQGSGYPWTQAMTESFLRIVNEECGYRGMEIFLETLRGKVSEADQKNIAFFCPTIGLLNVNHPSVSDFSGLAIADAVTQNRVMGKSIASIIPQSLINWVVNKVANALGKNIAKQTDKALNRCDVSLSLYQKMVNAAMDAFTLGLFRACAAS